MCNTHVSPKLGWILAGHKRETYRELDLANEARRPLYDYLHADQRREESAYVFTSQGAKQRIPEGDEDGWCLTEDGIHRWFQEVRLSATVEEAALIDDITFHDLRHDFGHRLREEGGRSQRSPTTWAMSTPTAPPRCRPPCAIPRWDASRSRPGCASCATSRVRSNQQSLPRGRCRSPRSLARS